MDNESIHNLSNFSHFFRDTLLPKDVATIFLIAVYIPIILVALIGNSLVLIVILTHKSMKNSTNFFLLNLAFGDLLGT